MTPPDPTPLLTQIRRLPELAEAAVRGLNDAQLDTPYGEGKWTPRQVVHHLADSHMNAFIRMKLILAEDNPTLKTYNQEEWARFYDARGIPVASSLAILRGLHERWAAMLEKVPESSWERTAHHPERGRVTLGDMLKIYARHGENHVGQITGLRQRMGW